MELFDEWWINYRGGIGSMSFKLAFDAGVDVGAEARGKLVEENGRLTASLHEARRQRNEENEHCQRTAKRNQELDLKVAKLEKQADDWAIAVKIQVNRAEQAEKDVQNRLETATKPVYVTGQVKIAELEQKLIEARAKSKPQVGQVFEIVRAGRVIYVAEIK